MTGELLLLILALICAWGFALVTYLPIISITTREREHETEMANYDDAA